MFQFIYDALGRRWDRTAPNGLGTTFLPPPCEWDPNTMADQAGKVAVVTGANIGIGYETVKLLLEHNATVFLCSRAPEKGRQAIQQIKADTGKEAQLLVVDLADLASVKRAAKDLESRTKRLDYLFLNAAVHSPPMEDLTAQGYDLTPGISLGHAHFAQLLLPLLKSTYQTTKTKPRVICVSSNGHNMVPAGDAFIEELTRPSEARTKAGKMCMYYYSKMESNLLANWLQRKHGDYLIANSLHPGNIRTRLMRNFSSAFEAIVSFILLVDAPNGALTSVYVACTPAGEKGGQYFIAYCRERTSGADPRAYEEKYQDAFMAWVDKCVADFEES